MKKELFNSRDFLENLEKEKKLSTIYDKNIDIFVDAALSKKEIEKAIENGILTNKVYEIATEQKEDGYQTNFWLPNEEGIKVYFRHYDGISIKNYLTNTSFYLTDFYLILCFCRSYFQAHGKIDNIYYENPDEILVVPLEKVEYIKLGSKITSAYVLETTVKKSPVKGAIVGAAIAGPTGAAIGAVANSGTKTKPGIHVETDNYDLSIKLKSNDKVYSHKNFINSGVSNIGRKNTKEEVDEKLQKAAYLINRASKKTPLSEKKKIVEETKKEYLDYLATPKKNGCYIATCVYGSYDCPEVWTLRRFRDNYLDKHTFGKIFIKTYYKISPKLVKLFGNSKVFKLFNKRILDKFVLKLKSKGYQDTFYDDNY